MMSFGWSTSCLGVGRLSILLLALVVVACSYITNLAGFDPRTNTGPFIAITDNAAPSTPSVGEELATFNIVGLNSHG